MKNLNYLILLLSIVVLFACSKDDAKENINVVGSWSITEGIIEPGSFNIDLGGMQVPVEINGSFVGIDPQNRIEFKEDKTFSSYTGEIMIELNMVVMGSPQTDRFSAGDVFGTGTWKLDGRKLELKNDNGATIPYSVDEISATHMQLSAKVKDIMPSGGSNPILESMDIQMRIKFKKI